MPSGMCDASLSLETKHRKQGERHTHGEKRERERENEGGEGVQVLESLDHLCVSGADTLTQHTHLQTETVKKEIVSLKQASHCSHTHSCHNFFF